MRHLLTKKFRLNFEKEDKTVSTLMQFSKSHLIRLNLISLPLSKDSNINTAVFLVRDLFQAPR